MPAHSKANPDGSNQQGGQHLLRRTIMGGLCSFLLASALLVVAVHLSVVQHRLLQRLVRHVEASAGIGIRYRTYHWRPFSMLQLDGLTVHAAAKQLLHCQTAQLSYHLSWKWPFLVPILLTLQKPVLYLQKDRRGRWIFPKSGSRRTKSGSESFRRWHDFPWPNLKIVSGEILGFQQSRQILAIHNLNGTLSLQLISGPNGPSLKIGLGQWQGLTQAP